MVLKFDYSLYIELRILRFKPLVFIFFDQRRRYEKIILIKENVKELDFIAL
jgi:hypothetical protein